MRQYRRKLKSIAETGVLSESNLGQLNNFRATTATAASREAAAVVAAAAGAAAAAAAAPTARPADQAGRSLTLDPFSIH